MPTRAQASTADRGLLTAWRRLTRGRAGLAALAATVALGVAASPASAAEWGYEQLSPRDSSSNNIYGTQVSEDLSTVLAATMGIPMAGMPADGRSTFYYYGLPLGGAPWTLGPVNVLNGPQVYTKVREMSPDGSKMLLSSYLRSVDGADSGFYRVDAQGEATNMAFGRLSTAHMADANLGAVAFLERNTPASVYVGRPGQAPVQVSVDNDGNPMTATALGGAYRSNIGGSVNVFAGNAFAADGSSVIFTSTDGLAGDNDIAHPAEPAIPIGRADLYRRILTPGHEETYAITDANGSADDDAGADAEYRWATADQSRVFFVTTESLEPGDTDGEQDIYLRDGKSAPVRVSQGEAVDGAPTGNGSNPPIELNHSDTEWALSSQDGNRTFFATSERLTQNAPAAGIKLYERDVAEGRTRFVAGPLSYDDFSQGAMYAPQVGPLIPGDNTDLTDVSLRGLRVTPNGLVFQSMAPLAGSSADSERSVFVWTRAGGVEQIDKPDADAPSSTGGFATILPFPMKGGDGAPELGPLKAGRVVSDDGSRVFFSTGQSLTAQDTDGGYRDLYVWSKAEGVRLVSPPGRAPYEAAYVDSSPDGSQVFFSTPESILPRDTDPNAVDIYKAILGGGSAPSPQVPDADPPVCGGAACQGPIVSVTPPSIGSVSFAGPGNVPAGPDPVSPSVEVSTVKGVTGSVATLKVRVPDAGRISVAGASLRSTSVSASKAGAYSVKVALTAGAKRTLKKKKSLKVSVRVSYQANDGETASKTVSVTFKQPKAKPAKTKKGGR